MLESAEEVRQAVRDLVSRTAAHQKDAVETRDPEAIAFRPVSRPPTATLSVLEDGEEGGERITLRLPSITIGRTEGDVVIPHDSAISGRHAEISRRFENGRYRWYLTDLKSTNGTFVRVSKGILKHQQEMLLGSHRYRFELPSESAPESSGSGDAATGTRYLPAPRISAAEVWPSLVEVTNEGEGQRLVLSAAEQFLGRDPQRCELVVNDPFLNPRHARIHRDQRGRWFIASTGSLNGVWLRIRTIALEGGGYFQCGEQRFSIKIPS